MPPNSDWDSNPELESAVWQASQRLSPAMAKKIYGFMKRTWSTALAELRKDDKAPDRPEDRRTHFVRAWISDTLWRLYQAGDNWSADASSMGIDTAEAEDIFSRVLSKPRVLPDEAGGRLPVPPRQWHVVTQAVEDTFEELSEARVVDAAERKKKRPGKPKPAKGQASRSHAASSHDSWNANADIPFWARKIWDRDNDTAYRSNSWQGDDQSKDFDRGKGKDRGREKGKEKGREKGQEKGKSKGKGKDKGKDGTADRCQSDSPLRTCSRSRNIEERLGGKLPTPRRSRSRGARDRSRRRGRMFATGAGRRLRASRSRRRRAKGGRRRRSVTRDRRPRSAGRTAREDARERPRTSRRSRSAKRGPAGQRSPLGGLRSVSRKMSPKVAKEALKLSEPLEPTAQSKAKPAKARSCSASSESSSASMETRPKAAFASQKEKEDKEEAEEAEEAQEEEKEREEESEREVEEEASPKSEAKLPEPEAKSKAKEGCSSSGSDSSDGSARPQLTKRQVSQEATKDQSEHEKSEEERQDAVEEDGVKAEVEASEAFAEVEDAVDLEADNFDDIDDEKLMAQLQQGLMKVEETEDTIDAAEPVELVECVNRNRGTCLGLRAENGEDQKLEHKLLFADDTMRGGLFTGMYCIKCAKIVEYSWRNVAIT